MNRISSDFERTPDLINLQIGTIPSSHINPKSIPATNILIIKKEKKPKNMDTILADKDSIESGWLKNHLET